MNLNPVISSELLFMINQLPSSLKNSIPLEFKIELNNNYDKEIYNSFIPDKPFYAQNISDEALDLFYDLISKYI